MSASRRLALRAFPALALLCLLAQPAMAQKGKKPPSLRLTVTINPNSIEAGETTSGTVSHNNSGTTTPVSIALTSSVVDADAVTIAPAAVMIPVGQTSAPFSVTAGSTAQTITINATASGYESGSASLTIKSPPPVVFTTETIPIGYPTIVCNGITNTGFVYGWVMDSPYRSAFVYDQDSGIVYEFNQIPALLSQVQSLLGPSWVFNSIIGMNDAGQMTGSAKNDLGNLRGFVVDPIVQGQFTPNPADWLLDLLPDFASTTSYGFRINSSGLVLGVYSRENGTYDAYLYNPWIPSIPAAALDVQLKGSNVRLNNLGQVAGVANDGTAFMYDPVLDTFRTFSEIDYRNIHGVNDTGVLLVSGFPFVNNQKPVRYASVYRHDGTLHQIPEIVVSTVGRGINESGDVAGNQTYYGDWSIIGDPVLAHAGFSPSFTEQLQPLRNLIANDDPLKQFITDYPLNIYVQAINDRDETGYSQCVLRFEGGPMVVLTPRIPSAR